MTMIAPWYELGYIIPHLYTDYDGYQFYRIAPEGMMLVTCGLNLTDYTSEAVESQIDDLWARFDLLARRKVDRISLSGVPVASVLGRARMGKILAEAEQRTGIACDTDLEAHIAALRHLGASRIAIASRWPDKVIALLTAYLAEAGIEVIAVRARARSLEANKYADPAQDHLLALELGGEALRAAPEAEALLMPGGLWYAIHAAPMLEAEFGKPVLLNITSTTWAALAGAPALDVRPDARWGKLMASLG